jgi:hypothetical protein
MPPDEHDQSIQLAPQMHVPAPKPQYNIYAIVLTLFTALLESVALTYSMMAPSTRNAGPEAIIFIFIIPAAWIMALSFLLLVHWVAYRYLRFGWFLLTSGLILLSVASLAASSLVDSRQVKQVEQTRRQRSLATYEQVKERGEKCLDNPNTVFVNSPLTKIDLSKRTINFVDKYGAPRGSTLCEAAQLLDVTGRPIDLAEFAVGNKVNVYMTGSRIHKVQLSNGACPADADNDAIGDCS